MAPVAAVVATEALQAEKLTLLVADNSTGYFGVQLHKPGYPKPYQARVTRGGKQVSLGYFATAEEAALRVARTPEGQAAAAERAAVLTSKEARQQAQAEKLTLLVAENKAGYFGVSLYKPGQPKPYQARVKRSGKDVHLGSFATAGEAALCVARSPEGRAVAAERAAVLTSEGARQEAQAEKLSLVVAKNSSTGYFGVSLNKPGLSKPYKAQMRRGGKLVHLGYFATAEEAALCVARTPEGRAAAARAAAAESQGTLPAVPSGASLKKEGTVPPMPAGAFVKDEGVSPSMPPDAFVKFEVVVKEEEGFDSRPKRQRAK
jgi:hypothetical protein